MNFFQQLSEMTGGKADLTIRIMQKGDSVTVNVMPGNTSATIEPIIATGTPAELDEAFFSTLLPGVKEVSGLITNLEDVKSNLKKKAEEKEKPATPVKKDTPKKDPPKKKKSKEPAVITPDIFSTGAEETPEGKAEQEDPGNDQQEEEQTSDDE